MHLAVRDAVSTALRHRVYGSVCQAAVLRRLHLSEMDKSAGMVSDVCVYLSHTDFCYGSLL